MRNSLLVSQISALIAFSGTLASALTDIQGLWVNSQNQISIMVENTANGMRVKRTDQTTWYSYDQYREGQFRDSEGNNYYIIDENDLEWEDNKGHKRLRFTRTKQVGDVNDPLLDASEEPGQVDQPNASNNVYMERHHYLDRNHLQTRSLDGRWQNPSTGQMILVKGKRHVIKVKTRRSGWTTFSRQDHETFLDSIGNRYVLRNGQLEYTSRSGDFFMRFRRGR